LGSKILDASAFYAGVPFGADGEWYTTPLVFDEIRHIKRGQDALNTMIDTGRLRVREQQDESREKSKES